MTLLDALHKVLAMQSTVLQLARDEKPTGSWPKWSDEAYEKLQYIEKHLRMELKGKL